MILRRLLTAAVGIPAVFFILLKCSESIFFVFVLLVAALALMEYFNMALPRSDMWGKALGVLLGCCMLASVFLESPAAAGAAGSAYFFSTGCSALSVAVLFMYYMYVEQSIKEIFNKIALNFFGIFCVALLFSYMLLIRARADGTMLLLLLICITWAGDSAAYFVGSRIGKRPLCPQISPKKTMEGAAGSLAAGVVVAFVFRNFYFQNMGTAECLFLGLGVNCMNQFGDMTESVIKRSFGVKDSGSFLPGHGGMLDRIDSLLFAAPFLFYYVQIVMPVI